MCDHSPLVDYNPLAELEARINQPSPDLAQTLQRAVDSYAVAWRAMFGAHDPSTDYAQARRQLESASALLLSLASNPAS